MSGDCRGRVDRSPVGYPGPTRVLSADERVRAGGDRPSRTLRSAATIDCALLACMALPCAPAQAKATPGLPMAPAGVPGWPGAQWLWRSPTRRGQTGWMQAGTALRVAATMLAVDVTDLPRGTPLRAWTHNVGTMSALLLTLAGIAAVPGVMPALAGAEVRVMAAVIVGRLSVSLHSTGPGPAPGAADAVGLANTRARLQQAFGAGATPTLENAAHGGCIACIPCLLETA